MALKTSNTEDSFMPRAPRPGLSRRESLVREMVEGAILPHLLERKDRGVFSRGPNVLRFPRSDD